MRSRLFRPAACSPEEGGTGETVHVTEVLTVTEEATETAATAEAAPAATPFTMEDPARFGDGDLYNFTSADGGVSCQVVHQKHNGSFDYAGGCLSVHPDGASRTSSGWK